MRLLEWNGTATNEFDLTGPPAAYDGAIYQIGFNWVHKKQNREIVER